MTLFIGTVNYAQPFYEWVSMTYLYAETRNADASDRNEEQERQCQLAHLNKHGYQPQRPLWQVMCVPGERVRQRHALEVITHGCKQNILKSLRIVVFKMFIVATRAIAWIQRNEFTEAPFNKRRHFVRCFIIYYIFSNVMHSGRVCMQTGCFI